MDDDEEATVRTLTSYRTTISDLVQQYHGRVVDSPGDNILAEFISVVDSVNCAVEIQRELAERNEELPVNRRMAFRIGVNLGDIIDEDGRIYGDGVNIAARVESLAEAGGICISGRAHDQVENKLDLEYEDLGKHEVKNISRPIQVYRVLSYPGAAAHRVVQAKESLGRKWLKIAISAVMVVVIAVGLGIWQFYMRSPSIERASQEKMAYTLPEKPSIAVLPFDNMSGDPEQEFFSDGFTEQIITSLSMVPKVFVIARNSTFTYKNKAVKVQQIAEDLGVRYILEGSIQKEEQRVRITAQFIDAISGRHLWAERYDRELKNIFALQDEITLKIISAIGTEVTSGERSRVLSKGTDNVEAYIKVLQGFERWYHMTKETNFQARKFAKEAIALDPEFPNAYCLLAATHFMEVLIGTSKSPRESLVEAAQLYQKVLTIDEAHPIATGAIAYVYGLQRQYDKAITQARRAIDLNPGRANPHLGAVLNFAGKYEEAIQSLNKTIRLDPLGPAFYFLWLGHAYRGLGQYEAAIAEYKRALNRQPDNRFVPICLAATYSLSGREDEARAEAAEVLRIDPNFSIEGFKKFILVYKDQDYRENMIEGLRKAGLPD
jgi:TolB-like protein/Tfp pilus assembly protein PilF